MVLQKGSRYILRFVNKGFELVYDTIVDDDDGLLITFKDKHGKELQYNRSILITAEKIEDKKEEKQDVS